MGKIIYVLQASADKGKSWFNLISEDANMVYSFEDKRTAAEALEIVYDRLAKEFERLKVSRVPKKYFRVKEYKEVE